VLGGVRDGSTHERSGADQVPVVWSRGGASHPGAMPEWRGLNQKAQ